MRIHPTLPDYYVYEKDGQWYKTDATLTKSISAHITSHKTLGIPKTVFYPNWESKGPQDAKYAAWRVNEDGVQCLRWHWYVRKHTRQHGHNCIMLDDNRCACRLPATIEWSDSAKRWVLSKGVGNATDYEVKQLDKIMEVRK